MVFSTLKVIVTVFSRFFDQSNLTEDILARDILDFYGCKNYYQKLPKTVKNCYFGVFLLIFFEKNILKLHNQQLFYIFERF